MKLAPIALFVYNRPDHTKKTIDALKNNIYAEESNLFIFSDGAKRESDNSSVMKVRETIKNIYGFKNVKIFEQEKNLGLANSIINGVTMLCNEYGKAIVLEDDLITSKYFLKFMNEALEYYANYKNVFTVCGFNFPPNIMKIPKKYVNEVFFTYRNNSTGWGTWIDRWDKADWDIMDYQEFISDKKQCIEFDQSGDDLSDMLRAQMEGKIDSWSIRWTYTHFKNSALAVYPVQSLINNIGFDGSGIHSKSEDRFNNFLKNENEYKVNFISPFTDKIILKSFKNIYKYKLRTKVKKYLTHKRICLWLIRIK